SGDGGVCAQAAMPQAARPATYSQRERRRSTDEPADERTDERRADRFGERRREEDDADNDMR
ncbi:hypothetical protein ABTH94_22150, partial [Acinetobacter baumannii]